VPPFEGPNMTELCGHHVHSAPVPPSERLGSPLPARLERLILACLAKSPCERPSSAAELQAALLPLAAPRKPARARPAAERDVSPSSVRPLVHPPESSGVEMAFLPTMIAA